MSAKHDPAVVSQNGQQLLLVLEDFDEDFDTVREALEFTSQGATIIRAQTGEECVELLRCLRGGQPHPVLALLDLNTYGLDGRQTLRELRAEAGLFALPIVVLSTSTSPRDMDYCYRMGANAFHIKPTRYTEHRELLVRIFQYWLGCVSMPKWGAAAP